MSSQHLRVAAVQAEPVFLNREATVNKALALIEAAAVNGAELIVFPEAFVPAYPVWLWAGRADVEPEAYVRLYANAVQVPDATTDCLGEAAARAGVGVAIGVTERDADYSRATLYNTLLLFDQNGTLILHRRKLMPTYKERTVWGQGDASSLVTAEIHGVRVGGLICWENLMPLARHSMYAQGEQLHIAPTADTGQAWQATLRHIAYEGRIFVISCCQVLRRIDDPALSGFPADADWLMSGGTAIISPTGDCDYLAGPVYEQEAILYADLDLADVIRAKHSFDVAGHYARADVLQLHVDRGVHAPLQEARS
ncbi:MAG TPA: carbon-nitrogen hydrolase family protein [Chloroflexota bacterium]|nr:carbon-nitrogen hydrolase family protein [Chloroflexota bacterium]